MKIKLFYTKFNPENKTVILNKWLSFLPESLQEINSQYQHEDDRVRNLLGKLLLNEGLKSLGCNSTTLEDIRFNSFKKPYLSDDFDFSISHSGMYVFCAISANRKLGIDIEKISPISFLEMKEMMTDSEWKQIRESGDQLKEFFKYWTLKEATIKAEGTGFFADLSKIEIDKTLVRFEDNAWHYKELLFDSDYAGHLVSSDPRNDFEMIYKEFVPLQQKGIEPI
ncbi:4'-phosphopantetheinyl transferase sfp [compost metagenome]